MMRRSVGVRLAMAIALAALAVPSLIAATPDGSPPRNASEERMQWFNEQRFGIFIHWGPIDVPLIPLSSDQMTLEEKQEAYANVYKNFNPVKYDAEAWAKLIKDSGARYAVLTTKHTVFYSLPLWPTKTSDHSIMNPECPYSQQENPDIVDKYVKALRKEGLGVGFYFTHGDRWHPDAQIFEGHKDGYIEKFNEVHPERWANFLKFERDQFRELLTNYGKIDLMWFDGWYNNPKDATALLTMMRELQPDMIVNDRGSELFGDYVTPEDCIPSMQIGDDWESALTLASRASWIPEPQRDRKMYMSLENNWWYYGEEGSIKSIDELIQALCTTASKNGNLLLNFGPRPDGSIVEREAALLRQIGEWLKVNGEAIYGTVGSPFYQDPGWGKVTAKGQKIYLLVFDWPVRGNALPLNIANHVKTARLLATGEEAPVRRVNSTKVEISLPVKAPSTSVSVIELEVEGDVSRAAGIDPIGPDVDGAIVLKSRDAAIFDVPKLTFWEIPQHEGKSDALINWRHPNAYPQWGVYSSRGQTYDVEITYRTSDEKTADAFEIAVGGKTLRGKTEFTGGEFKTFSLGKIELPKRRSTLTVKCLEEGMRYYNMDLRQLKLTPAAP